MVFFWTHFGSSSFSSAIIECVLFCTTNKSKRTMHITREKWCIVQSRQMIHHIGTKGGSDFSSVNNNYQRIMKFYLSVPFNSSNVLMIIIAVEGFCKCTSKTEEKKQYSSSCKNKKDWIITVILITNK